MRKLDRYVARYGPEAGPKLFRILQSQAGHASVSARLRRKIESLTGSKPRRTTKRSSDEALPLFPETVGSGT